MPTVEQYLAAVRRELGYTESPRGSNCNKFAAVAGHLNCQPWCATLLVAKANEVGLRLPGRSAYTPWLAERFQQEDRWSRTPTPGAFVFFDFPDNVYRIQHVGVVEHVVGDTVYTIEGNTSSGWGGSQANGGGCYRRQRRAYIVGYGLPEYSWTQAPVPIPPKPSETPVPHQPTDVTPVTGGFLVRVRLDGNGHGAVGPMDRVPWKEFAGIEKHAPYPPKDGYGARPDYDYGVQERDGHLLVVLYGKPNQNIYFHVRVKD